MIFLNFFYSFPFLWLSLILAYFFATWTISLTLFLWNLCLMVLEIFEIKQILFWSFRSILKKRLFLSSFNSMSILLLSLFRKLFHIFLSFFLWVCFSLSPSVEYYKSYTHFFFLRYNDYAKLNLHRNIRKIRLFKIWQFDLFHLNLKHERIFFSFLNQKTLLKKNEHQLILFLTILQQIFIWKEKWVKVFLPNMQSSRYDLIFDFWYPIFWNCHLLYNPCDPWFRTKCYPFFIEPL